jgi:hypothetical protein
MGMFKKFKQMTGSVDKDLLKNGLLGRGVIVEVQQTNVSTGGDDAFSRPVCVFTVEVTLDNVPAYTATCRQSVPITVLPQFVPGQTVAAVRVNPDNHDEIALDLATEPPEVTIAQGQGASAAEVLDRGDPVRAVIVQTQPLGMKNQHGVDVHAFVLTVMRDGQKPYQAKVGNPVPEDAVPLLFNGSNLPAKVLPEEPEGVVIDFKAALEEFTK